MELEIMSRAHTPEAGYPALSFVPLIEETQTHPALDLEAKFNADGVPANIAKYASNMIEEIFPDAGNADTSLPMQGEPQRHYWEAVAFLADTAILHSEKFPKGSGLDKPEAFLVLTNPMHRDANKMIRYRAALQRKTSRNTSTAAVAV